MRHFTTFGFILTLISNCHGSAFIRTFFIQTSSSSLLHDGPTLKDKLQSWTSELVTANNSNVERTPQSVNEMCKNAHTQAKLLTDAVLSAVNYYENHISQISTLGDSIGLQVLEGVLQHVFKRRGQNLHVSLMNRTINLIEQINDKAITTLGDDALVNQAVKEIGNACGLFTRSFSNWASLDVLHQKSLATPKIGEDLDGIWPSLNGYCFAALVTQCDVPYPCRRTILNPEPQSQYMLAHQALFLVFANQKSCQLKHPDYFRNSEHNLETYCSKMLKEAEFLADHKYPTWGRDLFSEYVFICSLAGYPNFLRNDWINEILTWQSKSDFGCFLNPDFLRYFPTETGIPRKATVREQINGVNPEEICLSHFSSTSLAALAVKLGWLHDHCLPPGEEFEIMMQEAGDIY
ncbi:hypothetical protein Fcan01_01077 [Folsomia candida]|uniref:Uncharacterized protein n=2 Tax=Folsomia candida TaxID=158441 RepID=A0A226EXJ5_FOLCA|nr:hypothetical protein Fcan01_01077 [Folsomia candida]